MKKYILLITLVCLSVLLGSAQTFILSPKVIYGSGSNSGSQDYKSTVTNNATSNNDTTFSWKILKYNPPTAWAMSFCDPMRCIGVIDTGMSLSFYISKGKSGQMHITYLFNDTPGSDTLKVSIQSVLNPSNIDTFTLYTNSWKTGVNEVSSTNNNIGIYPNPVKDFINLKYTSISSSQIKVDIYNIIGAKVKTFLVDGNLSNLNVSELKNGMYILRVIDGNNSYSKTFNKTE